MAHPTRPTLPTTPAASPSSADEVRPDLSHPEADIPRGEPWMKLLMLAIVPVMLTLVLPRVLLIPLSLISVALFVASLVMLSRQSRGQRTGGAK
jgi:hypothetical protein